MSWWKSLLKQVGLYALQLAGEQIKQKATQKK